jgi:hypothetical protein
MPQDPQFGDLIRIAFQAFQRKCFLKKNSANRVRNLTACPKLMKTKCFSLYSALDNPTRSTLARIVASIPAPHQQHPFTPGPKSPDGCFSHHPTGTSRKYPMVAGVRNDSRLFELVAVMDVFPRRSSDSSCPAFASWMTFMIHWSSSRCRPK